MDGVPALLQGLNGRQVASGAGVNDDEDGVFYDELISYPTQFRAPNHPPAYEVRKKQSYRILLQYATTVTLSTCPVQV